MIKDFEYQTKLYQLQDLKDKLLELQEKYKTIEDSFNELCDTLDIMPINENMLQEISTHLTIYLSEMDIIDNKMCEISDILENLKAELCN